jgi:hypothetical protein
LCPGPTQDRKHGELTLGAEVAPDGFNISYRPSYFLCPARRQRAIDQGRFEQIKTDRR